MPKGIRSQKNPSKMCQTPFSSHLRLCRGLGLRPGQGVFFGFAPHLPTRMDDMNRWMVAAPFWKRKGGTREAQFQRRKAPSISFRYFDRCHHFLHSGKSPLFSWPCKDYGWLQDDAAKALNVAAKGDQDTAHSSCGTRPIRKGLGVVNMFLSFFPLNSCENKNALLYYCIS